MDWGNRDLHLPKRLTLTLKIETFYITKYVWIITSSYQYGPVFSAPPWNSNEKVILGFENQVIVFSIKS